MTRKPLVDYGKHMPGGKLSGSWAIIDERDNRIRTYLDNLGYHHLPTPSTWIGALKLILGDQYREAF